MKEATVRKIIKTLNLSKVSERVRNENPRWSAEKLRISEEAYRGFLFIHWKYPREALVPSTGIDEFWHAHILYTKQYMKDCQKIFGHYMHHDPT